MKSERLLAMLLLLQARGRLPAHQIAETLEVSERTVYRDLDSLSAAGVPVHAERGAGGGIVLAEGYRKALTQFHEEEIRALFVSSANPLADLGLGESLAHALEKLAGALPETQRRAAQKTRDRIYVDQRRWKQMAQPREHLATLRRAVWDDRRATLRYKDRNGAVTERVIDPLGLVAKAGIWYLVARYRDEFRVFRAERIIGVEERPDKFERPSDFDLDRFWESSAMSFEQNLPAYPVTLRVQPEALEEVTAYWETEMLGDGVNEASGRLVRIVFPSPGAALSHVIAWGNAVDIAEPAELRERVVERARDVLARYAQANVVPGL
jgi:predicted DNA-binding transcriptional regulator YafY